MRRFARAAEQAQIPDYIDKQFFGTTEKSVLDDPYSKLRRNAQTNQEATARATTTYARDRQNVISEQPWARIASAETYQTPRSDWNESGDDLGSLTPMDMSAHSIRRASYGTDDVHNRSRDLKEILNENNFANYTHLKNSDTALDGATGGARGAFGRHASIFGNDMYEVAEACNGLMEQHLQRFDRKTQLEKKQNRHAQWEQEQMTTLASARCPDIVQSSLVLRTGEDTIIDSNFNLPNHTAIAQQEAERLRIQNERRAQSLSIKRNGKSPKERRRENHQSWEQSKLNDNQRSFQSHSSSWLDRHIDSMLED